jgi:tetratricopeptide (TPR) repeat protein
MADDDVTAAAVATALDVANRLSGEFLAPLNLGAPEEDNVRECIICLGDEGPPFPTQGGCGCRSASGLAHIACRVEAATRISQPQQADTAHPRIQLSAGMEAWWECPTCNQDYTGCTSVALAVAWVQIVGTTESDHGVEDFEKLRACDLLGKVLLKLGKSAEAAPILGAVLQARKQVFGFEQPGTFITCTNLASALIEQNKRTEAETLLKELLEAQVRLFGPGNLTTVTTFANLANILIFQKKNIEAELMIKDVLPVLEQAFGSEHAQTLLVRINLAISLSRQGKVVEAVAIYKSVLAVQRRVLGPEHPDTVETAADLRRTLTAQAALATDQDTAVAILKEVLAGQKGELTIGPEDPDTLITTNDLAATLLEQGSYAESATVFEGLLAIRKRVLGPDHLTTLDTTTNLACSLAVMGKYSKAFALINNVLAVHTRVLGSEHSQTLNTQAMLKAFLCHQENALRRCSLPSCENVEPSTGPKFKKCSRCKVTFYCTTECQRKHWKKGNHKQACRGVEGGGTAGDSATIRTAPTAETSAAAKFRL